MRVYLEGIGYELCNHCLTQMRRRCISEQEIQSCLDKHQVRFVPKSGYSLYIADHPGGRRLQVVVNTADREIVSAMWLE
jgi:hypothetical protein